MIDAIFFLLVFFMFSSLSMVKMKAMALSVPRQGTPGVAADAARPHAPGMKLVLTVDARGKYSINDAALVPAQLVPQLQAQVSAHPEATLVLNIDKGQTAQHLIDVMDAIHKVTWPAGRPPRVLIATEPVDTKGRAIARKEGAR